ncbi:MAG TPA: redoxin domain-containing protein [Gemmatimonadaceae bacterium]
MEAYRDQYATLFNNGRKVAVISISVDADTTQASWAHDENFPMLFASDVGGKVGTLYDTYDVTRKTDTRTLFVVGPDGKIAFIQRPFHVLAAKDYTDLGAMIDKLEPVPADTATH